MSHLRELTSARPGEEGKVNGGTLEGQRSKKMVVQVRVLVSDGPLGSSFEVGRLPTLSSPFHTCE